MSALKQIEDIRNIVQDFYEGSAFASETIERVAGILGMEQDTIPCPYHVNPRTRGVCDSSCPLTPHRCKAYIIKWGTPA